MKLFTQSKNGYFQGTTLLNILYEQLGQIRDSDVEVDQDEEWVSVDLANAKGDAMFTVTFQLDEDRLLWIEIHSTPIKKVTVFEGQKRLL